MTRRGLTGLAVPDGVVLMQAPPVPPRSRSKQGCLTALFAVGAVVVLGCVAAAIVLGVFLRSERGKKISSAVGEGIEMSTEGRKAPGVREVMKAGCADAMVLDTAKSWALMQSFVEDASTEKRSFRVRTMVNCIVFVSPPTCDEVKRAYLGAVTKPVAPFLVQVKLVTESLARCARVYDPEGSFLMEVQDAERRPQ